MPDTRVAGAAITVAGRELQPADYAKLRVVRVEESVHLPNTFELRFDDPLFTLFDDNRFALGDPVEIALQGSERPTVVTTGEVTAVSVEPGEGGRHELVVCGLDLTHRLAKAPQQRSFTEMTDADIAGQIARDHGLEGDIEAGGETRRYVLQANETDLAFLRRLAARIGFALWVSENTLHFRRQPTADVGPRELTWGQNLLSFRVRFSMVERCDEVFVKAWDPVGKRAILGQARDGDLGTDARAAKEMSDAARQAFGQVTRTATQFPVIDQAEADALATSLLAQASGELVTVRAETNGDPRLSAGGEVRLAGVGNRLSGTYRTTSVTHLISFGRPYVTRFVCGGRNAGSLADLLGGAAGAVPAARNLPAAGSIMVAQVTNVDDPDRLCRVKVRFPTLSDRDESTWARLVLPGAGPERGLQWMPQVNDEVIVGFELGDLNRPLVLGGVWNRDDAPPDAAQVSKGEVAGQVLTTTSGNTMIMSDHDQGKITIAAGDGSAALVLNTSGSSLDGAQELSVKASKITIEAESELTLKAGQVSISADGTLTLSGSMIQLN